MQQAAAHTNSNQTHPSALDKMIEAKSLQGNIFRARLYALFFELQARALSGVKHSTLSESSIISQLDLCRDRAEQNDHFCAAVMKNLVGTIKRLVKHQHPKEAAKRIKGFEVELDNDIRTAARNYRIEWVSKNQHQPQQQGHQS